MNIQEIYKEIKNPLNDPLVIERLVQMYSKCKSNNFRYFYTELVKSPDKKMMYDVDDKDTLYSTLFNHWKRSITTMSEGFAKVLLDQNIIQKDFSDLRNYLLHAPNISTFKEAIDFESINCKTPRNIVNAYEKYSWHNINDYDSWTHVNAQLVHMYRRLPRDVEARLYLNNDPVHSFFIATQLVTKCNQNNIPYYFKFSEYTPRADIMVIYSSVQDLEKHIDILKEISDEYPEIKESAGAPPLLTGKIDEWIGFGVEPTVNKHAKRESYNGKRSRVIFDSLNQTTLNFIMSNKDRQLEINNNIINFDTIVIDKITEQFWDKLHTDMTPSCIKDSAKAEKNLGYTKEDLESDTLIEKINERIYMHKDSLLQSNCLNHDSDVEYLKIKARNNTYLSITNNDVLSAFRKLSYLFYQKLPAFRKLVQSDLINSCKDSDIDMNTFCFDTSFVEKFIKSKDNVPTLE